MAMSSKFDLSSGSPDRALQSNGQRGSHIAASLDRSGSFRESMENPILSALPNMSRSSSALTQGDVMNFLQRIPFDPKLVAAEQKSNRQGDLKRHLSVALGISQDDSPSNSLKGKLLPSPLLEEIKRVKASSIKARERVKSLTETLSIFNKFFPSIPSKKRSRSEGFSNERSSMVVSSDRSNVGPSAGKFGNQSYAIHSGYELEQQKLEERTKNSIPNKRTRTSLVDVRMDVRSNAPVRPAGPVDRDRDMLRLANHGAIQGDERTLSNGVDCWEKSKMKKKRSGIKPDVSPSTTSMKPVDAHREPKQGTQQRLVTDARSRLNNDSHGFRPGIANGATGVGNSDNITQQTSLAIRSTTPKSDLDNNSLINDKRDRSSGSDKERVNLRAVNKPNTRDDFSSASPTSNTKLNSSVRGPRSGSGVGPKLSPVVHRPNNPSDWDISHCSNKPPAVLGANNRKRTASMRSSSPPVAHWAGQRPLKISRTARRTNFVPIVSSNDDTEALGDESDVVGNESGLGFVRRFPGSSPQSVKFKGDPLSSTALSESEESGAAEFKSRDKTKICDDLDDRTGQSVQKVSPLVQPHRKNKLVGSEDLGDGVRRQGRTGRGLPSSRTLLPMTEKIGNGGNAKQIRSAKLGFDKTESKAGRPPTRKLSDRRAYKRQKHSVVNEAADFFVGSDDGQEELLAAVNAVINPGHAFSNSFWRQMEPFFDFISDADVAFIKQQVELEPAAPTMVALNLHSSNIVHDEFSLIRHEAESVEYPPEHSVLGSGDNYIIPLCQRLIAALIPEGVCSGRNEDVKFDAYGTVFKLDDESESNSFDHRLLVNSQFASLSPFNGYKRSGELTTEGVRMPNMVFKLNFSDFPDSIVSYDTSMPSMICSEFQYEDMQINEKLLLELQSIGIFPEPVPDMLPSEEDEEISEDIRKLENKYHEEVMKKRRLLDKLLPCASVTKELQEKDFERCAMDKLVAMAYRKYMACRFHSATGGKNSSNKMAKQAALAFVKRTLERCHKFEATGKSCFNEPLFKDMFISWSSSLNSRRSVDLIEGESGKPCASFLSLEAKVPAPSVSHQSPSQFSQNADSHDINSSDVLTPVNYQSEQTLGREESWPNRIKKRELLLDDLSGPSTAPSGIGSFISSAKGKRSERDRDGKGHGREISSRNSTGKIGRPALSGVKGERKAKTKPKQKIAQLSASVNGIIGKISEQPKPTLPSHLKSSEMNSSRHSKEKDGFSLDMLDDHGSVDLSNLQLPEMDVLDVPDVLGEQEQDLGSWLNIDEDGLQDQDFMGLEIPMDDLSDLNMMV